MKLCEMLKNPKSVLEKLHLSFCSITEKGYAALASALKSNPSSHLIELDLSGNDPGDTGVKKLIDLLDDPNSNLKKLRLLKNSIAEEACHFLTKVLGINPLLLRELDLSGKIQGDAEMKKISDLLEDSHCRPIKLLLNKSSITEEGCAALSSALCSNPSHLIELDLRENKLGNSGVMKICEMLKNPKFVLQKLHLSFCSITEEGYAALAVALKSNSSSHLIELDLSGNDPGDTGVKMLIDLFDDPNSNLKKLRLLKSSTAEEACDSLTKVLGINPLLLRQLDLSGKIQGDSEMKKISDLLEDSHCRPNKLRLNKCSITKEGCAALSSALCSNPSHLRELDLSENKLGNSGVKKICEMLKNPISVLKKLELSSCSITKKGYADLAIALKSNPSSHLIELDLSGNDPGDTGVKKLTDLLDDPNSNLKELRLLKNSTAEQACDSLTKVLGINPLLLKELDLSGKIQGDSGIKKISYLLKDSHCRPNKLLMNKCSITEKGCAALSSALCSNPSHLLELDLSENKLGNSGVNQICTLLNNHRCKLLRLGLSWCSITEEGYGILASALKSNPSSHLIELDLRGNNPGETGVKNLTDLLEDGNCELKTIKLLNSSTAEEACKSLTKALGTNPLLLKELDLSGKIQGDLEIMKISDLLEDSHCRTQILKLNKSSITEEGCAAVSSALCSNPSHLIELDLSENKIGSSGVMKLCEMLKNPKSVLRKLHLSFCSVIEDGYAALASALKSNPSSHLIELDLSGNDPGDTGVKKLIDLLDDPNSNLKKLRLLNNSIAEEACGCLTKVLGINPLLLTELDLSGKMQGDSELKKISDLLEDSHCRPIKLLLNKSSITEEGCAVLSSALCSNPSHLIELDLSENKLGNSGVKKICEMLKNPTFVLQKLQLSFCSITEEGYAALASALKSNPSSHLTELDLSGNNPGDTGVKKLIDLLDDPNSNLKKLRLLKNSTAEEACDSLTKVLGINPLLLKELDLSGKIQGDSGIKKISNLLEDSHCRLNKLLMNKCSITEEGCAALFSALCSNPSHLLELDLSENKLGNSGMNQICTLLNNHCCKLLRLGLSWCSITEEGYGILASALKSNPSSHLIELDLRGNDPGETGVKNLTDLLEDGNCELKTIKLLNSSTAEEACKSLTKALGTNPLLLRELDLSGKIQGDLEIMKISDLLEDSHCRTQILKLNKSSITEEGCAALSSALCSNPSHLIELDLSENKIGSSGVMKLCEMLKNPKSVLQKLHLSFCSVIEDGYAALASALKSNPSSHLIELDLSGNDPGDTGVKKLIDLLDDPNSNLKKLRLLNNSIAEEACGCLTKVLGINPLLLTELDLSGKMQGDSELKKISDLLEDSHCRPIKLLLNKSSITEEGCAVLSSALCSNPSHLIELGLSENKLGNSGVMKICEMLKNPKFVLQKLQLSFCSITEEGYAALASALKSNPSSHLIELDLSGNNPGDTGVKKLIDLLDDPNSNLKKLRLLKNSTAEEACDSLTKVLGINPLLLKELDLSGKIQGDSGIKKISNLLEDSHCRLNKLLMNKCSITEEGCAALFSALCSNPSHLLELDLSENKLGNSGMNQICTLLNNHCCKLLRLGLSWCSITEEGYGILASALKSNPSSHLIELDLRGNDPGETGVKNLTDLLEDGNCELKTIKLLNSSTAEEACKSLTKALGTNPLLLKELDLSGKIQGDLEIMKISDLLEDSHCRTQILKLNKSSITEEGCAALSSALCSNPSHLIELDLSENKIGSSGVMKLCEMLKNPKSVLQKLHLSFCSVIEDGYAALASALKSNPSSHLIELDLSGNDPGDTGVKKLIDLLDDPNSNLKKLRLLNNSIAEEACGCLTKVLGINPLLLTELDLSGKMQGDSELKKISDLLEDSHCRPIKLLLNKSSITEEGCAVLSSALCSNPSHLIELGLSENKLGNSGVMKICEMLKNPKFVLQKLQLSFCSITEEGYAALASALKSNPSSHLIELDLSGNNPGDTGVKKLIDLLDDPNSNLKKLRLLKNSTAEEACDSLTKVLGINPLLLKELDLSGKIQGDSGIKKISNLLEDSHCRLNKLLMNKCSITEEGCAALFSALCSNPSHLLELDLSENKLGNSGMNQICTLLNNHCCKLLRLGLSWCSITEEGYGILASALKSNPSSHLIELDLRGNDPGETGVKNLTDLLEDGNCELKTIKLLNSSTAEEACKSLTKALGTNPLLLKELDLSGKIQGDLEIMKISDLLEDSHCRPQILKLNKSSITEEGCAALSSALCSNPSHLIELDLSENKIGSSGVMKLCEMLKNPKSVLQKLHLSFCSVIEDGYAALASALKSSPSSHLIELDLSGNDPGDTGVKKLIDLLDDPDSNLKKLRLLNNSIAEEACGCLTKVLGINPLLLRELDLSGKIQGDSELKKISDLLEDSHCRIQLLKINKSSITEEGCAALLSALCSNPSHLIELDLSENKLGNSGVKQICSLLNNQCCKLQKLSLSFCLISEEGYAALASVLKSNPSSHLIELDFRGNDPGDTGVKNLTDLLEDLNCKLKTMRLLSSSAAEEICDSLTKVLGIKPLLLRELDLSGKIQGDSELKKISDLLEDSHCRTQKMKMNKCSITEEGCAALSSALCSNPSHLIELDLSENKLGNSGVKQICSLLNNQGCKLQKLGLSFCSITEEGYAALASSLKSNPSSLLIELDLRGNDPGETGVKMLTDLLEDPNCKLKTTRLLNSSAAEEACDSLTKVLGINPLLLRELDLSGKIKGDSDLKKLSDLLEDSHCRTQKLKLNKSSITEEGCAALSSALCSNPLHLIELDLSENKLGCSGVKKICSLLNNQCCKLQKLGLSFCSITEEGYTDLASALKSNPSSDLIELELRGNNPGDTGVKTLSDVLNDQQCKLKKLTLLNTPDAEETCDSLTKALGINPLLLTELDLSGKIQGDSKLQQLCALLEDSHCIIKELRLSKCNLTLESCAALASILKLDSSSVRKMDLSNNSLQDSGMQHLTGVLSNPNCKLEIMILSNSSIREEGCGGLASALTSNPEHLMELDLSDNKIGNSGVKQLSGLLMNSTCMLQKLNLSFCSVTEEGYAALTSALKSNPSSHLIELDLRGNDPGDTGVKELTDLLEDPNCKLKTLRLLKSSAAEEVCDSLTKALGRNPLLLRELDLSGKIQGVSEIKISDLLKDSHCRIQILKLDNCSITDEGCAALASAFKTNPSHLRELDLRGNKVGNSGVKHLSELLKHSKSTLEKLHLSFSSVTEEGYTALASALKSNASSHLIELDLRGNNPGATGVKKLTDQLEDPNCKLKTLRLLNSSTAEEACDSLTKVLGINPLLLRELDLSGKIKGDSDLKKLSALLEDSHCRTQKIKLNKSSITEEGCAALSSALCSNPSHLIELDLNQNQLGTSGVNKICSLLKNSNCKLEKLNLSFCSVTEEGYAALASALRSNSSSHLIELDLRGNDPGDTGVKNLTDLLDDANCKLKTLRLLNSSAAEEVCVSLTKVLGINPLLLTELDLSGKVQEDSELKKISDLLEDSHCRAQKLKINKSSITEEGCAALSSALCSKPSHLIELDLSDNKLGNSGVKQICSLLNNQCCKLQKLNLSFCSITEEGYAALASVLKSNLSSHLIELDLRGNDPGETGVKALTDIFVDLMKTVRLLKRSDAVEAYRFLNEILGKNPLLQRELDLSKTELKEVKMQQLCALLEDPHYRLEKLTLSNCSITDEGCAALASAFRTNPSHLRELELSGNKVGNSGVKQISELLKHSQSILEKLHLSFCSITEEGYADLASALKSNPSSHLIELDLRGNDPGDTGVKKLIGLQKHPNCNLRTIRLFNSSTAKDICDSLTKALGINPLLSEKLDLSGKIQGDSELKKISDLLEDSHCRTQKLMLNKSRITEEGCAALSSALCSNPSHLIELDLSENKLGNSGVKQICSLLNNQCCKLQKLKLSFCSITEEGYAALASALKSNLSPHLIELDLRGNDPGDTGVEKLTDLLKDPECKLKTLRLLNSSTAVEICDSLTKVLGINPLLLRELDLSGKIQGDSKLKKISDLLKDSQCRTQKLTLNKSGITEKGCAALSSALYSKPSHLIELDLSENKLGNSGVNQICSVLNNQCCKLQKLNLSFCNITEEGYAALASALKSNPSSHLIELDLRGNDPGETGVKKLTEIFVDSRNTLRLLKSSDAVKAYTFLNKILGKNPLLQRELDLSKTELKDIKVQQLCALLEDPHYRLEKLMLNNCSITDEGCAALASAFRTNPSHLRELDLSGNKVGNSGVKQISELLKHSKSTLEKLHLSFCSITEEGYAGLASALKSNPSSHLIELDLRGNDPGDTGVKLLTVLQKGPKYKLKTLRLFKSSAAEEACGSLSNILGVNPLLKRELDLSGKIQGDSEMKKICDLLQDSHCRTQILKLNKCSITEEGCAALSSAVCSNASHLIELDLRGNELGNCGVKKICDMLKNATSQLRKLNISYCSVTEEGYTALASALKSNPPSHLVELDLRGNDPGDTGVQLLTDLFMDSSKTLRLLNSDDAEEAWKCLNDILRKNPLLQRELDLSTKEPKDIKVQQLCALLEDPHYRLEKLTLYKSGSVKGEGCADLISALTVNPSHLRELDLNKNKLEESGVKELCNLLKNPHCKLEKLKLKNCGIKEEGCAALAEALKSNPSHLKELDLHDNKIGNSVNDLEVLKDSGCKILIEHSSVNIFLKEYFLGSGVLIKSQKQQVKQRLKRQIRKQVEKVKVAST
ncbi:uncharacterized protein LOC118804664 isoform X1 [Colossoma macropomum]|uniref:uncharacterized protein LOC118804664 isoform X1 n=1 Tax=Colossoma macropomum TaxID=42526 RepID=UPI001863DD9F|nr:uncharacterized protein LOC118804664 isoform X1 [Colossoma macropomum]